jgi:hypothetical protein
MKTKKGEASLCFIVLLSEFLASALLGSFPPNLA